MYLVLTMFSSFPYHILLFGFCLKINSFLFFFSLPSNLFDMSCGNEFNPTIVERKVHPLAPNLQDVKAEVKEENDRREIIDEEYDGDPPTLKTTVENRKPIISNEETEENVKEENETDSESEELKDFIIKEELVDEVGTGAYALNQEILDERGISAEEKSMKKGSRILTHAVEMKPHKCVECGKSFSQSGSLSRHILIHTGVKPHKCKECGKSFPRNYSLSQHMLIHTGEKPHNCKECGKSFTEKSHLSKHMLIHTGEKCHNCENCGKSFTQKSHLSQHMLVHTKEKPHNCEKCGKSFSRNGYLSQHILKHTKEKPHSCEKCGKSFSRKSHLFQHFIIHTGEKTHNCKKCGKCFSFKGSLSRHVRKIHPQYVSSE